MTTCERIIRLHAEAETRFAAWFAAKHASAEERNVLWAAWLEARRRLHAACDEEQRERAGDSQTR